MDRSCVGSSKSDLIPRYSLQFTQLIPRQARQAFAILAFLLAACATVTMAPPAADLEAKKFTAPSDTARLYVTRPGSQGGAGVFQVIIDGRVVGNLPIQSYLVTDVAPGQHTVTIALPSGSRSLAFEVKRGELVFFRIRNFGGFRRDSLEDGMAAVRASFRIAELAP